MAGSHPASVALDEPLSKGDCMRKLFYSSGSVLIADATCKAVLRYARALATAGKSDIVDFPIIEEGGKVATAHFLIGPASELFSVPVENTPEEHADFEVIAELERMTAELDPERRPWRSEMTDIDYDFDMEYNLRDYPSE